MSFHHCSRASHVFAIQLSFLLRSNSRLKCDPYSGSQTVRPPPPRLLPPLSECSPQVLHPLPEDSSKDHARRHSDYAHNLPQNPSKSNKSDLELRMLRERDTDKLKRSENKVCILNSLLILAFFFSRVFIHFPPDVPTQFYGFLRRGRLASRSAPKKRRSRSADEIAEMQEPLQSTTSLANGGHSVQDHGPSFVPLPIKRGPIIPSSRPLSTATVTQKLPEKKLPQLPSDTVKPAHRPVVGSAHVINKPEHMKPRKKSFFGMITLPNSRNSSITKSRPTSPHSSTPDNSLNSRHQRNPEVTTPTPPPQYRDLSPIPLNDTTNYRWNGTGAGVQRSQPSFDISEPDSGLGIETVVAKTGLVTIVSSRPQPRLDSVPDVPTRASPIPPRTGHGVDKSKKTRADETVRLRPQDPNTSGRTSPLMMLASSKVFGGKGKERERSVDRGKDVKMATPAPTSENERGRESKNSSREHSKPNTPNISGPMNLKVNRGRIKHGSFDFERPLSTSVGYPVRSARWSSSGSYRASSETERNANGHANGHLWNNPNSSTYPIQEERSPLGRSQSVRNSDHRGQAKIRFADETKGAQTQSRSPYDTRSRAQHHQHSSPPSRSTGRGPGLLKNRSPSPAQANPPYRPEGGSWGRNTSKRAGPGTGYADGMPSFGMSATSLHLDGDTNAPPSRSNSPQISTIPMDRVGMKRHTGKGRSLDLGLELNWAPTRVKEEAVMNFSEMGVRSKWREEAEMKELCRTKVLESFERVLGENGSGKFKERA